MSKHLKLHINITYTNTHNASCTGEENKNRIEKTKSKRRSLKVAQLNAHIC